MKKSRSPYAFKQEDWKQLYNSGMSFSAIAKQEGIHYRTVQNVLKGIVEPRPKQAYKGLVPEWIEQYKNGLTASDIAKKYDVNVSVITRYLKKEGIQFDHKGGKKRLYEHLRDIWINEYKSGSTLKDIANKYGTSPQTIKDYLNGHITLRSYTETSRLYNINEKFFDVINIPDKAYWLGLMYSSGCLIRGVAGYAVQFSVGYQDKDRINRFKELLEIDAPTTEIKQEHQGLQYQVRINSKHLFETLSQQGLKEEKLKTIEFPYHLNPELYCAFILGYYEGKGSCYKTKTNGIYLKFNGTLPFLKSLQRILNKEVGTELHLRDGKGKTTNTLETGKYNEIVRIANWIYSSNVSDFSKRRDMRQILGGS